MTTSSSILYMTVSAIIAVYLGYWYATRSSIDGFGNADQNQCVHETSGRARCPNLLVQKGTKFYLYNSKLARIPGVNPVMFNTLEDYLEFLEWQRGAGIRCPVLYVQYTYDVHGEPVYKVHPSVTDPQGGLPPNPMIVPPSSDDAATFDTAQHVEIVPGFNSTDLFVESTTQFDGET